MSYFNTTRAKGAELFTYRGKTLAQDHIVLEFFEDHPGQFFTPSEVHHKVFSPGVPLTSVRRAMSNLAKRNKLTKTERKKQGPFGRPEYCWRLYQPGGQLELL